MSVRAKFWVKEVTHHHNGGSGEQPVSVKLSAVYGDGKGNEDWSKYTPSGEIQMMITNPKASDFFSIGARVYVDFSPAD